MTIVVAGIISALLLLGLIYYLMSRLIKKLEEARQMIEEIAITHQLTEVFNRRHLMSQLEEEFEQVKRLKKSVSCIMADVDNFKHINDSYGHLVGDQVLKAISHRIRNTVRAYDILGRYGGEEFLIILPDTTLEDARGVAERIRIRVKEETVNNVAVTLSLGVVIVEESDQSLDDISSDGRTKISTGQRRPAKTGSSHRVSQ
jgi:diguanylate cyclase (GGDEF)-like protein